MIDQLPDNENRPLPEQQAFINRALVSHALLVAGPGTGKTWTLSRTAERLVLDGGADINEIALLTLTRSMAGDLAERIPHGRASTLHAFALSLLNRIGEAHARRIADSWEQKYLIREDLQTGIEAEFAKRVTLGDIEDFLDRLGTSFREDQREPADLNETEQQLLQILNYQKELFRYRLLDELIWTLLRLIEEGAEVINPPRFVLADEYQDLTAGELRLLNLLSERFHSRVIACGDDRQSIFGFRDADPLALHRFPEVYRISNIDYLSKSRRCPEQICNFAELITGTLPPLPGIKRPELQPWEGRQDTGTINISTFPSPIAEARWLINEIRRLIEVEQIPAYEIMVIVAGFRDQVQLVLNQAVEENQGLPFAFYNPSYIDPFVELLEARLLNAGMRLLKNPEDQLAWRTLVWATPGLGPERQRRILTAREATYIRNLRSIAPSDSLTMRTLTAGEFIIRQFRDHVEVSAQEIVQNLSDNLRTEIDFQHLQPIIAEMGEVSTPDNWIHGIIERSQKNQVPPINRPNDVPIRTIFSAKGLQSRIVYLVNAIPQSFSRGGQIADGIRRLYVAITRAKETLYISAPRNLRYTPLGHATNANYGGLPDQLENAGRALRIDIQRY